MLFVSVGYPLGLGSDNNYQIETMEKIIKIPTKDFVFWRDVSDIKNLSDEQLKKCAELRDLGLLIYAETDKELFPLIMDLRAIRQGVGWWDTEHNQPCIFIRQGKLTAENLAENLRGLTIPTLHHVIWGCSDGIRSLKNIYDEIIDKQGGLEESDDPIFDFVCGLIMLADSQFIFFR